MKKSITFVFLFSSILFSTISAFAQHTHVVVFSTSTSIEKGKKAMENGEIERAIGYYNSAIRKGLSDQEYYTAYNDLCVAYYLKEELNIALRSCDQAIRITSNKWIAYNNRGNIHLAAGRFRLAIADYEKGLGMKKSSEILKENLEIATNRLAISNPKTLEDRDKNNQNPDSKNSVSSVATLGLK